MHFDTISILIHLIIHDNRFQELYTMKTLPENIHYFRKRLTFYSLGTIGPFEP
jgi:hypothetical protein